MQRLYSLDTLWVENFDEIALSRTVKEIEANFCFAIFGKNSKIQNGRHFWGGENFSKIAKIIFLRYPVGRKFRRNRSISHDLGDMSTFAFFSTQNSQLLIYLINYSLIYEAIPPKSNPIQAINPMNLHTKFQKDRRFILEIEYIESEFFTCTTEKYIFLLTVLQDLTASNYGPFHEILVV